MTDRFEPRAVQSEYLREVGFCDYVKSLANEALDDPSGVVSASATSILREHHRVLMGIRSDTLIAERLVNGTIDTAPVRMYANDIIYRFQLGAGMYVPPDRRWTFDFIELTIKI